MSNSNCHGSGQKVTRVKGGSASYLLQVKSKLRSGWVGPISGSVMPLQLLALNP